MDRTRKLSKTAQFTLILLFYFYVFQFFAKPIYKNITKEELEQSNEFHTRKKFHNFYFTGWNFGAQMCYLFISIYDELTDLFTPPLLDTRKKNNIKKFRNYFFSSIIFPCAFLVCGLFWCLYLINMDLVCPQCDKFYPKTLNHTVHSVIIFPTILEVGLPTKHYFVKFKTALNILTTFIIIYLILYFGVYFIYDIWLYPIFGHLTWIEIFVFLAVLYATVVQLLYLGLYIQNSNALADPDDTKK